MDKKTLLEFVKSFWMITGVILFSFALVFIFWFMVVNTKAEFLQKNDEYNVLAGKRANTLQVNRDREGLEILSQRLENSFVSKDRFVEFIDFVESSARNTGNLVSLSNISEGNNVQNLKINLEGSYSATVNFLAQIENSPYLVRSTNIIISKSSDSERVRTALDIQIQLP
ncbi:MAG: hypothetical protein Q8Q90_02595 [bacterium]|nr:hypothetical protein [bacterium]